LQIEEVAFEEKHFTSLHLQWFRVM